MAERPKSAAKNSLGWWAMGVVDGFRGTPAQRAIPDALSYFGGRAEGEAAKEQGRTIDDVLEKARAPYREAQFRPEPSAGGRSR